jgi:predicted nucleic acid-binding protein
MARPAQRPKQEAARLILDSSAVIALARGDQRARAFIGRALELGAEVLVPSVVVAETVRGRGPKDSAVNRVLAAVDAVYPVDETLARRAGALLGSRGSNATIDALVVAAAAEAGGGRVLTSDVRDMNALARGAPGVRIHRV